MIVNIFSHYVILQKMSRPTALTIDQLLMIVIDRMIFVLLRNTDKGYDITDPRCNVAFDERVPRVGGTYRATCL